MCVPGFPGFERCRDNARQSEREVSLRQTEIRTADRPKRRDSICVYASGCVESAWMCVWVKGRESQKVGIDIEVELLLLLLLLLLQREDANNIFRRARAGD